MSEKKVLIAIINYNQSEYIEDCLISVLCQSYNNKTVIIVDNNSSDFGESEFCKNIAEKYGVYFLQRDDRFLVKCLNEILERYNCDYVSFLAADDVLISNKIQKQVEYMDACNKDIAACFGDMVRINYKSEVIGINKRPRKELYEFQDVFTERVDLYAPTALYRYSSLKEVGFFNENHNIEDLSIYLKLTDFGFKLSYLPLVFVFYRIHDKNTHGKYKWMMQEKIKIWNSYDKNPLFKKGLMNIYLEHFSNFGSTNKLECLKLLPKVIRSPFNRLFLFGVLRFLFDYRFFRK